jgi:hypothetical protein
MLQTEREIQITRSAPGARRSTSLVQFGKLRFRQMNSGSGDVLFDIAHFGGPGKADRHAHTDTMIDDTIK